MLLTVFYITSAVKLFEKLWDLVVFKRDQIRVEYLLVLPPMFYANIYSWWATIMYLNDAWYKMIKHQVSFQNCSNYATSDNFRKNHENVL